MQRIDPSHLDFIAKLLSAIECDALYTFRPCLLCYHGGCNARFLWIVRPPYTVRHRTSLKPEVGHYALSQYAARDHLETLVTGTSQTSCGDVASPFVIASCIHAVLLEKQRASGSAFDGSGPAKANAPSLRSAFDSSGLGKPKPCTSRSPSTVRVQPNQKLLCHLSQAPTLSTTYITHEV